MSGEAQLKIIDALNEAGGKMGAAKIRRLFPSNERGMVKDVIADMIVSGEITESDEYGVYELDNEKTRKRIAREKKHWPRGALQAEVHAKLIEFGGRASLDDLSPAIEASRSAILTALKALARQGKLATTPSKHTYKAVTQRDEEIAVPKLGETAEEPETMEIDKDQPSQIDDDEVTGDEPDDSLELEDDVDEEGEYEPPKPLDGNEEQVICSTENMTTKEVAELLRTGEWADGDLHECIIDIKSPNLTAKLVGTADEVRAKLIGLAQAI